MLVMWMICHGNQIIKTYLWISTIWITVVITFDVLSWLVSFWLVTRQLLLNVFISKIECISTTCKDGCLLLQILYVFLVYSEAKYAACCFRLFEVFIHSSIHVIFFAGIRGPIGGRRNFHLLFTLSAVAVLQLYTRQVVCSSCAKVNGGAQYRVSDNVPKVDFNVYAFFCLFVTVFVTVFCSTCIVDDLCNLLLAQFIVCSTVY